MKRKGDTPMELNSSERHINKDVTEILLRNSKAEVAFKGTVLEGKERRYTVINERDVKKYLEPEDQKDLQQLLNYYLGKIEEGRAVDAKEPFNAYLVINTDELYAAEVIDIMKRNGHLK